MQIFLIFVCVLLTFNALLLLLLPVLLLREMSSMSGEDEQEGLVAAVTDAVAVQCLAVLSQPLPNHPALQRGDEPEVVADL